MDIALKGYTVNQIAVKIFPKKDICGLLNHCNGEPTRPSAIARFSAIQIMSIIIGVGLVGIWQAKKLSLYLQNMYQNMYQSMYNFLYFIKMLRA
jgi:hypothetical protein